MSGHAPSPPDPHRPRGGQSLILEGAILCAVIFAVVTLLALMIIPVVFADDLWRTPAEYWVLMSDRGEIAFKTIIGATLVGGILGGIAGARWERRAR